VERVNRKGLAIALVVLCAVSLAAGTDLLAEPGPQLGCRILPNAVVPVLTGRRAGCPLQPYDRILAVAGAESAPVASGREIQAALEAVAAEGGSALDVLVVRGADERWLSVPLVRDTRGQIIGRFAAALLVSAVVMAVSLIILWGSAQPSATPFAYFYACASVVLFSVLCGRYSEALVVPGVVAAGLIPATLAHVALTFPTEREIVRSTPQIVWAAYAFSGLITLIAVLNLERSPVVWVLADRMILVLSLVTWSLLVVACVLAVRESTSVLERARAKVVLAGTAVVPALALAAGVSFGSDMPGGSLALTTLTLAVLPLPIGYAISHYRLFDLELQLRRVIAYLLYVAVSAAVISGLAVGLAALLEMPLPFGDPAVLFAVAFAAFLVGDPLRARLRGAIDSWMAPALVRMRAAAEEHGRRVAELLAPEDCARLLCRTAREGAEAEGASVFLAEDGDWRLAHASGPGAPLEASLAARAAGAVADDELLYLADREPLRSPLHASLRGEGIEVVASLNSGDQRVGLLLLTGSRRGSAYTTLQLRFIETAAKQSAVAIHNAYLARSLMTAERLATQGRLGAGLIHDLGKPLGVVERLSQRLADRLVDRHALARDARTISDLASQMRLTLRDFLHATRDAVARAAGPEAELDALIDRAVRAVERSHGRDRVSVRLEPGLPTLRGGGEKVVRAVTNLLDNALLASDPSDVVEVAAGLRGGALEISVIDRGEGMDASVMARAFEPFFSTRAVDEGSGLGLAVCRDLVEGLGGDVALESAPGGGTRARLRIPCGRLGAGSG
jgi:signal transduction histidine kinase